MSARPSGRARWPLISAIACLSVVTPLAASLGWLKWHESDLVFRTAESHARAHGVLPAGAEPVSLQTSNGERLAAFVMRADPARDRGYWILHLHGNADSAFSRTQLRHCQQLSAAGFSVLCFDYRGFGQTPGVASELHLTEDAETAFHALLARGIAAGHIIIWGHSLGSAPAVELAARHPEVGALVLFGAFTSVADVAAETYPYLPVRWIVGVQMNSLQRIRSVHVPVVIAHSTADRVIPFQHGLRLYAAANAPKRLLVLDAGNSSDRFGGHVDALYDDLAALAAQLEPLLQASRQRD
jgi:pimeloyl-ACP methyl ester carboxylesterase